MVLPINSIYSEQKGSQKKSNLVPRETIFDKTTKTEQIKPQMTSNATAKHPSVAVPISSTDVLTEMRAMDGFACFFLTFYKDLSVD